MTSKLRTHFWILFAALTLVFSGCDNPFSGGTASTSSTGASSSGTPGSGTAGTGSSTANPTILGTPANSVVVGAAYSFHPTATVPEGGTLTFTISNQPSWTSFDATTGALSGTPTASDIGTFANITISVSDGGASVALAPFTITVVSPSTEAVTLSWMPPEQNTNGTTSTNLAGYKIYYGESEKNLNKVVTVEGNVTNHVFDQLPAGTWYFAVAAFNSDQVESALSAVVPLKLTG